MSLFKVYGFTAEELQTLQALLPTARWAAGQLADLVGPQASEEVWVVHSAAAEVFLAAGDATGPPRRAVVWVPAGVTPSLPEDWWEGFDGQLQAGTPAAQRRLQQLAECARMLTWFERVEDVTGSWFAGLTGSPRLYELPQLPFNPEEQEHLQQCALCREEAYAALQQRAEQRWVLLCPGVDEFSTWLETGQEAPHLESHVRACRLCREQVIRHAWLLEGAGLLTAAQVEARLVAIGQGKPSASAAWLSAEETPQERAAWEATPAEPARAAIFCAALWLALLCRRTAMRPARRLKGSGADTHDPGVDSLQEALATDAQVTLVGDAQWLQVQVAGDTLELRLGRSPADRFERFRVEARRGEMTLIQVAAERAVVRLTPHHFHTAHAQGAEQWLILV